MNKPKKHKSEKPTPEKLLFYKELGGWLRKHPEIYSKKLTVGWEVNIGTIREDLEEEWLEVSTFEIWQSKRKSDSL